jgi:hypothetical protein
MFLYLSHQRLDEPTVFIMYIFGCNLIGLASFSVKFVHIGASTTTQGTSLVVLRVEYICPYTRFLLMFPLFDVHTLCTHQHTQTNRKTARQGHTKLDTPSSHAKRRHDRSRLCCLLLLLSFIIPLASHAKASLWCVLRRGRWCRDSGTQQSQVGRRSKGMGRAGRRRSTSQASSTQVSDARRLFAPLDWSNRLLLY